MHVDECCLLEKGIIFPFQYYESMSPNSSRNYIFNNLYIYNILQETSNSPYTDGLKIVECK